MKLAVGKLSQTVLYVVCGRMQVFLHSFGCLEILLALFRESTVSRHFQGRLFLELFLLDLFFARTPFILQFLVKRKFIHILAPPFAPAGQEDPLRVVGQVIAREGTQDA